MNPIALPPKWYVDADHYALERDRVFASSWICVGHTAELAEPGSVMARTVAGWPLLVGKNPDGRLVAFHNVCRHRAGPLLFDGMAEKCDLIKCRYHGWKYDYKGTLKGAPGFGTGLARRDLHLHAVIVDEWRGVLFVHLGAPKIPLAEFVRELDAMIDVDWSDYQLHSAVAHEVRCNWKTYAENYLEGYHIAEVHPGLSAAVDIKAYQVEVNMPVVRHRVPTVDDAPLNSGLWAWIWPNLALNLYSGGLNIERMVPVSPTAMRIEYVYLFDPKASGTQRENTVQMSAQVTAEDRKICEAVQQNLQAGVYTSGPLSLRHEAGVAAFQERLRGAVGT